MKRRQIQGYMAVASTFSRLSWCNRLQVGCVIVQEGNGPSTDNIISYGYNGTPPGEDNCCEDCDNVTKSNVIHAEMNALNKLDGVDLTNTILFVTTSCCTVCADEVIKRKIPIVIYDTIYRSDEGIQKMKNAGIIVQQINQLTIGED